MRWAACLARGEFPLVLGGDCSILLGNMLGLRRRGEPALIYIDGHTDFYLPEQSTSGGAAGMDLAFVTGWGPDALTNIEGLMPYVREERVAALGNRDFDRLPPAADALRCRFAHALPRPGGIAQSGHGASGQGGACRLFMTGSRAMFSSMSMSMFSIPPSCRLSIRRRPDGLRYDELTALLKAIIGSGLVSGMEVTIFDPDLDPDGHLARELANALADSLRVG